jgi:pilus assembly protein CpaC
MRNLRRLRQIAAPTLLILALAAAGGHWLAPRPAKAEEPAAAAGDAPAKTKKNRYKRSKLTSDESEATADHRPLYLSTGEDRTVDVDFDVNGGANGIAIGNPTVVATTLVRIGDKRQIVFKPLKSGNSTVTVRDADGTLRLIFDVKVGGSSLLKVAGEVRNLLRDIEGIDIRIVGQKIVIDGEVLVPADYGRLESVTTDASYKDVVMNLATLSPLAMQVLAKRIQEDINTFAPNVRTRVVNGMIFLEGQVDSKDQADRALRIGHLYMPASIPSTTLEKDNTAHNWVGRDPIQTFLVINPPPAKKQEKLVRVTIHFVELDKDYLKIFGFKWEPGFTADPQIAIGQGQTGAAGTGASFSATISSLIPHLQSLQKAGYARILKSGTVIVRSGQPASLTEQQQLPFAVQGPNGQTAPSSATVGLEVGVTPKILGQSEDIEMDLKINQVSVVGRQPANGGAPTTSSHKVDTKIYVKSSESAAVAGVTSSDIGTDFNKDDPNSGSFAQGTDPLFTLEHTKNYHKKKSQFVIFVTPQIIENASEGTDDLKKNFRVKVR